MDVRSVPFPEVPATLLSRFDLRGLRLRSLTACARAIDVDFHDPRLPQLVTHVLESCVVDTDDRPCPADFFWALTIGVRVACLLELAMLDAGPIATQRVRCRNPRCAAWMEVELQPKQIAELQYAQRPRESLSIQLGRRSVQLRLPTGIDQRLLAESADEPDAIEMARRILPPGVECSVEELARCEAVLVDADPLIEFYVHAACPDCGSELEYLVDLQELALNLLHARQRALLAAIHTLAVSYHWSERDIIAMRSWRRAHYLRQLEREAE